MDESSGTVASRYAVQSNPALHALYQIVLEPPSPASADDGPEPGSHVLGSSQVGIARHIVERITGAGHRVVHDEGAFYLWGEKRWEPVPDHIVRRFVHGYDGMRAAGGTIKLGKSAVDGILHELSVMLAEPGFFAEAPEGINASNGFIRFDDQAEPRIEAHHPDHRQRHVLSAQWHPDARPDDALLRTLLRGCFKDDVDGIQKSVLLAEMAGAIALGCATKLVEPKAVVLYGPSAQNGKSQVLDALMGIVSHEAVVSVPISDTGNDRYRIQFAGKRLNACAELGSGKDIASDKLKSLVTGDMVSGRDVYKSAVTFRPEALHVFATNVLPAFQGGMDRGLLRRLLVVPFERVIPEDEQVERIGQRIAEEETDALLRYAVWGARRLVRRRRFTEPRTAREALRSWIAQADPVLAFLEDDHAVEVVSGPNAPWVRSADAYAAFQTWARANGFGGNVSSAKFIERLVSAHPDLRRRRTATARGIEGLRLVDPTEARE